MGGWAQKREQSLLHGGRVAVEEGFWQRCREGKERASAIIKTSSQYHQGVGAQGDLPLLSESSKSPSQLMNPMVPHWPASSSTSLPPTCSAHNRAMSFVTQKGNHVIRPIRCTNTNPSRVLHSRMMKPCPMQHDSTYHYPGLFMWPLSLVTSQREPETAAGSREAVIPSAYFQGPNEQLPSYR